MATRGFLKVRTSFEANPADGSNVKTSSSSNLPGGLLQIKKGEDLVGLISREGFHDDSSGKRGGILACLHTLTPLVHHMIHKLCNSLI